MEEAEETQEELEARCAQLELQIAMLRLQIACVEGMRTRLLMKALGIHPTLTPWVSHAPYPLRG